MANPMYGQNKADNAIDALIDKKNVWTFDRPPIVMDDGVLGGAYAVPAGGDKTIHLHNYPSGSGSLYALQLCAWNQVAQDIDGPAITSTGMDYENENDDNDGVSWVMSYPGSKGIADVDSFTVGTKAFYTKLKFSIADVSVLDDCAFGFRMKSEAAETNFDDFSDVASLNVISGDINVESILNNAATVTTDTTDNWGDGETHTLEVRISASGVASYYLDGRAVTTSPTSDVTFDSGDVFTPFMFFLHASNTACAVVLQELETGLL